MKNDLWRIFIILVIALLLGISIGRPFLVLLVGSLGLLIWQTGRLYQLHKWLKQPKTNPIYETQGLLANIHKDMNQYISASRYRKQQLINHLKRFKKSVATLPDAIILIDSSGRIEWGNNKANDILSINLPSDIGVKLTHLLRHKEIQTLLNQSLEYTNEHSVLLNLNTEQTLSIKMTHYDECFRMLVISDISELINAYKMQKIFVADASHELKTPLTVILGYLEIISKHPLPENLQQPFNQIHEQSRRMQLLTEDLLYLSQLESGKAQYPTEVINIKSIIDRVITSNKKLFCDKKISVSVDIDEAISLKGDQKMLYNAFSNLFLNAINYNQIGGQIKIDSQYQMIDSGKKLYVTFSDTGIGISALDIPKLTSRFYRVDNHRSRALGGTGLGLAIVKQVLDQHNAKLIISSQLDKGSEFSCVFKIMD